MSSVYSGGLVYEYSEEDSGYGLVKINGDSVTENEDFTELMNQFKSNPSPEGDGGYKSDGSASPCPANSDSWDVTAFKDDELPAIPDGADKFMKDGAGTGPGLQGDGSQNAGGGSTSTAQAGSGSVTAVASNAASSSGSSCRRRRVQRCRQLASHRRHGQDASCLRCCCSHQHSVRCQPYLSVLTRG
jgi:hypothetical protein